MNVIRTDRTWHHAAEPVEARMRKEAYHISCRIKELMAEQQLSLGQLADLRLLSPAPLKALLNSQKPKLPQLQALVLISDPFQCSLKIIFAQAEAGQRSIQCWFGDGTKFACSLAGAAKQMLAGRDIAGTAKAAGLSPGAVRDVLAGRSLARWQTIFKLARACGFETYLRLRRPYGQCTGGRLAS